MSHHDWQVYNHPDDLIPFEVDLGCGTLKKAKVGIDRYVAEGVDIVMDLDDPNVQLPFEDSSIPSIITHHCLEHIGERGFVPLMDECYRVLMDGGVFRIIVPLFPSRIAIEDPDHKRWFIPTSFNTFCGTPDSCWLEGFSVPYTKCRFEQTSCEYTPAEGDVWEQARELRVTLRARK